MKFTNKYNIPEEVVSCILANEYISVGDISVSGLISSPRQRQLWIRHFDSIVIDVSSRSYALMGTALHSYIAKHSKTHNSLSEEILITNIDGWDLKGQPDLLNAQGILRDYKNTSVWAVIYGKIEWEYQLNCYKILFECYKFNVSKLQITAFLRDWNRMKSIQDKNYPQCNIHTLDIPMWPTEKTLSWIKERINLHRDSEKLADDKLPLCSDQERWKRPDTFACMKKGGKRATRVFETKPEAETYCIENNLELVERKGMDNKCNPEYCPQCLWCDYYKSLKEVENDI